MSSRSRSRSRSQAPPLAPREWAVALCGSATLAFSAWGLAGMVAWTLHLMLAGGLLTFFVAMVPMPGSADRQSASAEQPVVLRRLAAVFTQFNGSDGEHGNWQNACRLFKSPVFWLGGAFLLYLLVGALNPAIVQVRDERGWWVEAVEPPLGIHLPTSVQTDYEPMNAWRAFNLHLAAFSLVWGLQVGLRRRKSVLLVLWVALLSGVGMGFVAILQHFSDASEVLWTVPSQNVNFWGSFFYRNQGAAYLNWILVGCGVLYFYHARRSRERMQSGGPHFLCFLAIGLLAASVALALSRGGILFAAILTTTFVVGAVFQFLLASFTVGRSLSISLVLAALLGIGAWLGYRTVDWSAIEQRFGDIRETLAEADQDARALSSRATWDMAQDRLLLGWGGGSFRYIFPMYQRNYPEIFYGRYHQKRGWIGRKYYEYAHNDGLQFVAEYGLIGSGLLLLTVLALLAPGFHYAVLARFGFCTAFLVLGTACAFAHAFLDFIFNSPAYWVAFLGMLAAHGRLLSLEARRSRPARTHPA